MASNQKAVVVCCYGVYDPKLRDQIEMEGLDQYRDGVAEIISNERPSDVIFSGGFTNPGSSESEAKSFYIAVEPLIRVETQTLLEESSHSTAQNICFSLEKIQRWMPGIKEVIIICDSARKHKVEILAHRLLDRPWRVIGIPRRDISRKSSRLFQLSQEILYRFLPKQWIIWR